MKDGTLKVGDKTGKAAFICRYDRPENVADCLKIAAGNEAVVASMFNRGLTIWYQDRVGRPMFGAGASQAEIQEALNTAVPGVTKGRGRPRKEITVSVKQGKKYTAEEVAALLATSGIKTVTE